MNPAQLIENRSVLLIFRDCLKLATRMVDDPVKVQSVRRLVKQEFFKNRDVLDQEQIRNLKLTYLWDNRRAARGISNYIIHTVKHQYNIPNPHENAL